MSACSRCGKTFACGMGGPADPPCWCTALPPLRIETAPAGQPAASGCYCPDCLRALVAAQQADAGNECGQG